MSDEFLFKQDESFNKEVSSWSRELKAIAASILSKKNKEAVKEIKVKVDKKQSVIFRVRITFSALGAYIYAGASRSYGGSEGRSYQYNPTGKNAGKQSEIRKVNAWRSISKNAAVRAGSSFGQAGKNKRTAYPWFDEAWKIMLPKLQQIVDRYVQNAVIEATGFKNKNIVIDM